MDLASNAESLGADVIRVKSIDEFRSALDQARAATGTTAVHIETDTLAPVPSSESWWDVPVSEVAQLGSTQQARKVYESAQGRTTRLPNPRSQRRLRNDRPATFPGFGWAPRPTPGACGSPRTRTRWAGSSTWTTSPTPGYIWTELGPQGFLPQDPQQLRDELDQRGLKVCGGTVFAGLHKGKEALDKAIAEFGQEAKLLTEVGAKYLIHLPEQYTDMHTGEALESADIDPEQWSNLVSGTNELGRVLYEEFGVELVFHPHADTHVDTQDRIEKFLDDTDPQFVNLCLDTGHIAYCGGDNLQIIEQRSGADHLRAFQVGGSEGPRAGAAGEAVAGRGRAAWESWSSRPYGEPQVPPLLDALAALDRDIFTRHRAGPVPDRCRTCRWPSRPGRPGTSPPWASAPSAAGRTELLNVFSQTRYQERLFT